jgi:hypothetical protein
MNTNETRETCSQLNWPEHADAFVHSRTGNNVRYLTVAWQGGNESNWLVPIRRTREINDVPKQALRSS